MLCSIYRSKWHEYRLLDESQLPYYSAQWNWKRPKTGTAKSLRLCWNIRDKEHWFISKFQKENREFWEKVGGSSGKFWIFFFVKFGNLFWRISRNIFQPHEMLLPDKELTWKLTWWLLRLRTEQLAVNTVHWHHIIQHWTCVHPSHCHAVESNYQHRIVSNRPRIVFHWNVQRQSIDKLAVQHVGLAPVSANICKRLDLKWLAIWFVRTHSLKYFEGCENRWWCCTLGKQRNKKKHIKSCELIETLPVNSLLTQCCSRPHWPHRAGELTPHEQPPLTQQAHFCSSLDCWSDNGAVLPECTSFTFALLALFLLSHAHGHPEGVLVHKSTWPKSRQKKRKRKANKNSYCYCKTLRKQCQLF